MKKVLVFDDSHVNRVAATLLLAEEYDLTVVGTYDEAQGLLETKVDYKLQEQIFEQLREEYSLPCYAHDCNEDQQKQYWLLYEQAKVEATMRPDFDAVLTDLLVPASAQKLSRNNQDLAFKVMPLGSIIALLAIQQGVKHVAVVTTKNHHLHPASAALDCFFDPDAPNKAIKCVNQPDTVLVDEADEVLVESDFLKTEAGWAKYPVREQYKLPCGLDYGKNWKKVLESMGV